MDGMDKLIIAGIIFACIGVIECIVSKKRVLLTNSEDALRTAAYGVIMVVCGILLVVIILLMKFQIL